MSCCAWLSQGFLWLVCSLGECVFEFLGFYYRICRGYLFCRHFCSFFTINLDALALITALHCFLLRSRSSVQSRSNFSFFPSLPVVDFGNRSASLSIHYRFFVSFSFSIKAFWVPLLITRAFVLLLVLLYMLSMCCFIACSVFNWEFVLHLFDSVFLGKCFRFLSYV